MVFLGIMLESLFFETAKKLEILEKHFICDLEKKKDDEDEGK